MFAVRLTCSRLISVGRTGPTGSAKSPRPPHFVRRTTPDHAAGRGPLSTPPTPSRLRQDPVESALGCLRSLVFSGTHPMISDGPPADQPRQIVDVLLHGLLSEHHPEETSAVTAGARDPPAPYLSAAYGRPSAAVVGLQLIATVVRCTCPA